MSIGNDLRNPIWVRFADPDKEPVREWCERNSARNAFDAQVLSYPATKVLAAHRNGTVYAYMPVQSAAMLESIGTNPTGTTPLETAASVMEMVQAAATIAHGSGFRELYFLASDEVTAEGAKKLGFEEVPYKLYRMRMK